MQRRLLALTAEHPDLVIAREKLGFSYLRGNAFNEALEQFVALCKSKPEEAKLLFAKSQTDADVRWRLYESLAARDFKPKDAAVKPTPATVSEHP